MTPPDQTPKQKTLANLMSNPSNPSFLAPPERVLSTLEADGSRRWLSPRLAKGRFLTARRAFAWLLILIFAVVPYVPVNGHPAMLIDLVGRKLHLLGMTFLPTDTLLLALLLVSFILSIFFVTALLGRVWCGWACPQTVYMEFVFRPIERLFLGRAGVGGAPAKVAMWRKPAMYATYLVVCMHMANTFLAYFVPVPILHHWITGGPWHHPIGFAIVVAFAGAAMFNFAWFREQTCLIVCPYGRMQSALLDRQSLIITYDTKRGEPRTKGKRVASLQLPVVSETRASETDNSQLEAGHSVTAGDCIDCTLCVQVCPTGIDIRQGLQMECVGCAQCVDACDHVMDKIGLSRGLIRYSSAASVAGEKVRFLRPRVVIYPTIILILLTILTILIATKSSAEVTLLRNLGRPFVVSDSGRVENTVNFKLTNRSDHNLHVSFSIPEHPEITISATDHDDVMLVPGQMWTEPMRIICPQEKFDDGTLNVRIAVSLRDESGCLIETIHRPFKLIGPDD